jgi:predicted nucleotidyltransferase
MTELDAGRREVVDELVHALAAIGGVRAVALGGSRARGRARPGSDVDLGVYYSEAAPFDVERVRKVAEERNDSPRPVVTGFQEWGRWVNGGAWLTLRGQRVDLLYRSLEHLERTIAEARAGRYEIDWAQQPPFGFFGPTYLGELAIAVPLHDPERRLAVLKERATPYPEALRRAVVADSLGSVAFGLRAFAPRFAAAGDAYGTVGCLARFAHRLVLALFALNRVHFLNEKTALAEIAGFAAAPPGFARRVQGVLAAAGASPEALAASVAAMDELFRETVALSGELYSPRALPG